jgi:hypothetical protein
LPPTKAEVVAAIDARLQDWQQGDVLLAGEVPFVYLADYDRPVTLHAQQAAAADQSAGGDSLGVISVDVPGLAILTQTCDLIRSCLERPLVQVAALAPLQPDILDEVIPSP